MKRLICFEKVSRGLLMLTTVLALSQCGGESRTVDQFQQTGAETAEGELNVPRSPVQGENVTDLYGSAAQRVYIDPKTGEFTGPPAKESRLTEALGPESSFSTSDQGLTEVPIPGGGFMVDLQGRFRNPLIAKETTEGEYTIEHASTPTSQEKE